MVPDSNANVAAAAPRTPEQSLGARGANGAGTGRSPLEPGIDPGGGTGGMTASGTRVWSLSWPASPLSTASST